MVTLKNVIKENDILYADYFPEDKVDDIGHIEYDLKNNKEKAIKYCQMDKDSNFKPYARKAILAIKEKAKENIFPSTFYYMWY